MPSRIRKFVGQEKIFQKLTLLFLLITFFSVINGAANLHFPIKLLFPSLLLTLTYVANGKRIRPLVQGYLILPFLIFLVWFVLERTQITTYFEIYVNFQWMAFVAFGISCAVIESTQLAQTDDFVIKALNPERMLIKKSILVMVMMCLTALMVLYFKEGINNEVVTSLFDPRWLFLVFMMIAGWLQLEFLYKNRFGPNPVLNDFNAPSKRTLKRIQNVFLRLLEEDHSYLDNSFTKKDLAKAAKVNMRDLDYFFDKYMEKKFRDILIEFRIAHAKNLLIEKGHLYTVESIAEESGFGSQQTFVKHFQRLTGKYPSEYLIKK